MDLGIEVSIAWNCDFCKKPGLKVSLAGIIYCPWCRMSYGEDLNGKSLNI